jgi:hypothetical protein
MTMNQGQFVFAHLPGLLQNVAQSSVEDDFRRMVAVEVNFHLPPPSLLALGTNRVPPKKIVAQAFEAWGFSLALGDLRMGV